MTNEIEILGDVAQKLEQAGIAYMLTGSMAMSQYAVPRFTRDIDLIVQLKTVDADKIHTLFSEQYYLSRPAVSNAISRESMFNLIHFEYSIKVDFVVLKSSEYRQVEFARKQRVKINGFMVWIVSKEDLILSKLLWAKDSHSEMQLKDVKNLIATDYDEDYIRQWTQALNLSSLFEECISDE